MKTKMSLISLSLLLILTACGGGGQKTPALTGSTHRFGSQQLSVLGESSRLSIGAASLQGTGAVLFTSRFPEVRSGGSVALNFSLEDGGSLTLISHSDSSLENGYELEFRRLGTGTGSLKVSLRAQGNTRDTVNNFGQDVFSGIDASLPMKLQIDVHNNESPAHVMVWSRLITDDFSETAAILNTEDEIEKSNGSPGIGSGTSWGLKLNRANVTGAEPSPPKFEE
jgi:hypothetical protein